jgi:hypothetical protein
MLCGVRPSVVRLTVVAPLKVICKKWQMHFEKLALWILNKRHLLDFSIDKFKVKSHFIKMALFQVLKKYLKIIEHVN